MHVVAETQARVLLVVFRQVAFPCVPERRMTQVVPKRDRLDELDVQSQKLADGARDAADELHVQAAAADIVVFNEREHLRLVGVAVVSGNVDDLLDVARECGPRQRCVIVAVVLAAHDVLIVKSVRVFPVGSAVGADGCFDFGVEGQVRDLGCVHMR